MTTKDATTGISTRHIEVREAKQIPFDELGDMDTECAQIVDNDELFLMGIDAPLEENSIGMLISDDDNNSTYYALGKVGKNLPSAW